MVAQTARKTSVRNLTLPLDWMFAPDPYFDENEETFRRWRQLTWVILPLGLLGLLQGLVGELGVRVSPFDQKIFPPMILYTVVVGYFLLFRPKLFTAAITAMLVGLSFFLLLRTTGVLFFAPPTLKVGYELAEPLLWSPLIYLFAFLIPKVRGGFVISAAFTLGFVLLMLLSLVFLPTPKSQEVVQFLILANLVNLIQLVLSMGLVRLQNAYSEANIKLNLLNKVAYVDSVTGLPNRSKLEEILESTLHQAAQQHKVALLFIDIDRFKLVNDTLGHQAGDQLLQAFAERLRASVRDEDMVARINGDEFVVIARLTDPASGVDMIVKRFSQSLKEPFEIRGQKHRITASIGGCLYPDNAENAETLLRHADSAMYKIKKSGKNGFSMFDKSDVQLERRQQLEKDLLSALEQGQFLLHYQPMYDLKTNRMVKLEALLRWKHPGLGFISPLEFIPIAEESGQITEIGNWVLQEACMQARRWQLHQKLMRISVNVSSLQFAQENFLATVTSALAGNNLPASALELEVTEGALMNQPNARDILNQLQTMGISIAIDDFGTGYSSLAYLRDLPVDTIKIDKSFVHHIFSGGQEVLFSKALISTIVALAKYLDLNIVAEGVETTLQHHALIDLGCHVGQGFLFSKPLPADSLEHIFSQTDAKTLASVV